MAKPITTFILDDEPDAVEVLSFMIAEYCSELTVVGKSYNGADALKQIEQLRPSLLLLDINIGSTSSGKTIFDFLPLLPDYPCEFVFITAYDQYAIRAVKLHAFDYLLKPVEVGELKEMSHKIAQQVASGGTRQRLEGLSRTGEMKEESKEIWLPVHGRLRKVILQEILWVKAEEHYTRVGLAGGEVLFVSRSFRELKAVLVPPNFFCTHRSYLANMDKIKEILYRGELQLVMEGGFVVPVARNRRGDFLQLMGK